METQACHLLLLGRKMRYNAVNKEGRSGVEAPLFLRDAWLPGEAPTRGFPSMKTALFRQMLVRQGLKWVI